jgi:hypothetical protein
VQLELVTDCGPANDTNADHSLWGEPKVVEEEPRLRVGEAR